jgi:hypothetical protein
MVLQSTIYIRVYDRGGFAPPSHHRPRFCQPPPDRLPSICLELQGPPNKSSAARDRGRMLSYILGHDVVSLDRHLRPSQDLPVGRHDLLDTALSGIEVALTDEAEFQGVLMRSASCQSVVQGALALYGMDQHEPALELLSLIKSRSHCEQALIQIVRDHFDSPEWTPVQD